MISNTKFIFQFIRSLNKPDTIFAGNVFHEKGTPKKKKKKTTSKYGLIKTHTKLSGTLMHSAVKKIFVIYKAECSRFIKPANGRLQSE